MKPTCTDYTVRIKTYDPSAPVAYKCMNETEYSAYRSQIAESDKAHPALIAFVIAIMIFTVFYVALLLLRDRKSRSSR